MTLEIKQEELFPSHKVQANSLTLGKLFLYEKNICQRIKPVAYMLNSSVVQEKLAAGYIMYTVFATGKCSFLKGAELVEPVQGKLSWSKL